MQRESHREKARTGSRDSVEYGRALGVQEALVARRQRGELGDLLWLLEHPPTLTWGTSGGREHLLLPEEKLHARGFALHPTRRGGDITCHEPGQLVGYPIVDLSGSDEDRDIHEYLRKLEEALIQLLGDLGLEAGRVPGRTGVWLDSPLRKIAAMGVRCSRWVTSHGFALNVANTLDGFELIVPCGISDAGVTSLARELGRDRLPDATTLDRTLHRAVEAALGRPLQLLRGREALGLVDDNAAGSDATA